MAAVDAISSGGWIVRNVKKIIRDDTGAVTVDWVVLAGAVVAIGIGVVSVIERGSEAAAGDLMTTVDDLVAFRRSADTYRLSNS